MVVRGEADRSSVGGAAVLIIVFVLSRLSEIVRIQKKVSPLVCSARLPAYQSHFISIDPPVVARGLRSVLNASPSFCFT